MPNITSFFLGTVFFAQILLAGAGKVISSASGKQQPIDNLLAGQFKWTISSPLIYPAKRPPETVYSVKDPTIVRYEGRWHLFCTIPRPEAVTPDRIPLL